MNEQNTTPETKNETETKTKELAASEAGKIFSESIKTAGNTIRDQIIVPIIKQAAFDISSKIVTAIGASITGTLDCLIFGKDNMGQHNANVGNNRISYNDCFQSKQPAQAPAIGDPIRKTSVEFNAITYATREDAQIVLDTLGDIISRYGKASLLDYYDVSRVPCPQTSYSRYGWRSIASAQIIPSKQGNGFLLGLPEAHIL